MLTKYQLNIAEHYFAYRPPLHKLILKKALKSQKFEKGLDVGCGTGHSSIALKQFCSTVTGIDPSEHMINKAIQKEGIRYIHADLFSLPKQEDYYNIITFAGSLFYTKSQDLLDKISTLSAEEATVLIYDFKVDLENICLKLFSKPPKKKSQYNHQVNFSGLDQRELPLVRSTAQSLSFKITSEELAHLILSSQKWYEASQLKFGIEHPFKLLTKEISKISNEILTAEIYFSIYQK